MHLSMRVPWRDQPWDHRVCADPLDNSSCLLLKNIGAKRNDEYEVANALGDINLLQDIPCLSERGTFMSAHGYQVTKTHPYARYDALKGHLEPTILAMPGYSFEAVPYRWMARESFESDLWGAWQTDYDPEAENRVKKILGMKYTTWVMDGSNQQRIIRAFFEPIQAESSLVFIYLKHSPFQDERTDRLLVGAAMIDSVVLPGFWTQSGGQPFDSSMWETKVVHSLRPDQKHGVLLPYQQLVRLMDDGLDIAEALAWAPEGRDLEFSYVTEHVTNDVAIDALSSLRTAAAGMQSLGIEVPASAIEWIDTQTQRLWEERGPTPGLPAVLSYLNVKRAHIISREVIALGADPWGALESGFADPTCWPDQLQGLIEPSSGLEWTNTNSEIQAALRLLSTMDLRPDQVRMLMSGKLAEELDARELLEDPYLAAVCSYAEPERIDVRTVDRALFTPVDTKWIAQVPSECAMSDARDWRRVRAFITDFLKREAQAGDTIVSEHAVVEWVNQVDLPEPIGLSPALLRGLQLDAESLKSEEFWSPFYGATLGDGQPAYKLRELVAARKTILDWVRPRLGASRFKPEFDARAEIDAALPSGGGAEIDGDEEAARTEKSAGLSELFSSRISVLVGPAGTGKTTLLKALTSLPEIQNRGVLLLAPTGKASVQMRTKVGLPAKTLASFLVRKWGYDPTRDIYRQVSSKYAEDAGLVVIDEASMLTEEMLAATLSALGNVQRLILVGDPRQLPPIGAGRPFVDLVNMLRPSSFDSSVRVGASYVELTVSRRQGGSNRDDVLLAQWFGDGELGAGADSVWERLRTRSTSRHVEHRPWTNGSVVESMEDVLRETVDWTKHSDREIAFKLSYGGTLSQDGKYLNWVTGEGGAGARVESWQILSPFRSREFGTVEMNRHIKRTLRTGDLKQSFKYSGWRNPRAIGPEQIVRGDKVMQTTNDSRAKAWPDGAGLDYVANGEIGVVTGKFSNKPRMPAYVEFSSQVGATYSYWPSGGEDQPLELAWAVTVHKSQGSEFGTTILVLPKNVRISRELLYTALTRQKDRVILLHDGSVDDLVELAHPRHSETARRLTDLFIASAPTLIEIDGHPEYFDANLVHVTSSGVMVRSKNEVIVADILDKVAGGRWRYEVLLRGDDGTHVRPDFTVSRPSGVPVYWEHLGMMNQPSYARRWAEKLEWYRANGVVPALDSHGAPLTDVKDGPNGLLVWTDDANGVNAPAWLAMAQSVFGSAGMTSSASRGSKVARLR